MDAPLIVSIQHFCLHDGPGIRSIVFFKGCPLRCSWCQNPETWSARPDLAYKPGLCLGCGRCVASCPTGSLSRPGERGSGCRRCLTCAEACPSGALCRIGTPAEVDTLLEELRPEYPFFEGSGGGVTFSGGEPTLFAEFGASLARRLRRDGVHVALETCGHFNLTAAMPLLSSVDLVLYDLKLLDSEQHWTHCGSGNRRITDNLGALAAARRSGPAIWPRLPLVPGITDEPENLVGWARLLSGLGLVQLTLVPYHRLGQSKREWLGMEPGPRLHVPSEAELEAARHLLRGEGITCHSPGEEPWDLLPL